MANLFVTSFLSYTKGNITAYTDPNNISPGTSAIPLITDGKNYSEGTQTIGTTDETLPLGDVGTIGYIHIRNRSTALVSAPGAPIVTTIGSAGSTTWTYKIVAFADNDKYTVAGSTGSTATGNATLNGTNYNFLKWLPVEGAASYDIYRTVASGTPSTTGFLANVLASTTFVNSSDGLTYVFVNDQGAAADGTTAPTTTPWDFKIVVGSDGSSYPMKIKGNSVLSGEWNAAAIHVKASFNPTVLQYLIIEA